MPYSFNVELNNKVEQEENNVVDLTEVSKPLPVETNKITDMVEQKEEKVDKLNVNNIDQFL